MEEGSREESTARRTKGLSEEKARGIITEKTYLRNCRRAGARLKESREMNFDLYASALSQGHERN